MESNPHFIIKDLKKSYSDTEILSDLDLTLYPGINILQGENGAGKSTLLKIISGELLGSAGYLDNQTGVGFPSILIPDSELGFFPMLTGQENIDTFINFTDPNLGLDNIDHWKSLKPFEKMLGTPYYQCSRGMKKLLQIFVLTRKEKMVYLLDEPFKGLDQEASSFLVKWIKERKDKIFLLTTHSTELELSEKFGDVNCQFYKLVGGRIVN